MNTKQARAILALSNKIQTAVDECLSKLEGDDLVYAQNYWGAHLKAIAKGQGYGSMPIAQAEEQLEPVTDSGQEIKRPLGRAKRSARLLSRKYNTFWYVREVVPGQFEAWAHDSGDDKTVATFYCGQEQK